MLLVLASIEIGFRLGCWRIRQLQGDMESEGLLSAITGAQLALLAFILAFSFSMAANHYQERRSLVMADANAIGTAYQRATLLDSTQGNAIAESLFEYAELRSHAGDTPDPVRLIRESERIQREIWEQVADLTRNAPADALSGLLIRSLNEAFDIHEERRVAVLKNRVPSVLWGVLIGLLVLSMLSIGYFSGCKGRRNPIASTGMALCFTLVLIMIVDLDRPTGGGVQVDQSPMQELRDKLAGLQGE